MTKDSPCNNCEANKQCRDMCPLIEKWIEKKEMKEKLLDSDIPLEILGIKIDIPTIH